MKSTYSSKLSNRVCFTSRKRVIARIGGSKVISQLSVDDIKTRINRPHFGAEAFDTLKSRIIDSNDLPSLPQIPSSDSIVDLKQKMSSALSQFPDLPTKIELPSNITDAVKPLVKNLEVSYLSEERNQAIESLQASIGKVHDIILTSSSTTSVGTLEPHWGSHLIADIGKAAVDSLLYSGESLLSKLS